MPLKKGGTKRETHVNSRIPSTKPGIEARPLTTLRRSVEAAWAGLLIGAVCGLSPTLGLADASPENADPTRACAGIGRVAQDLAELKQEGASNDYAVRSVAGQLAKSGLTGSHVRRNYKPIVAIVAQVLDNPAISSLSAQSQRLLTEALCEDTTGFKDLGNIEQSLSNSYQRLRACEDDLGQAEPVRLRSLRDCVEADQAG